LLLAIAFTSRRALARGVFAIGKRIKIELWLLTAVVAATAVLVELPLPREAAPLASATTSFTVRDIAVRVNATAAGPQTWTFHVAARSAIDAAAVSVRETRRNVGPLDVAMKRDNATSYSGTVTLPFEGEWSAYISVRSGPFDEDHRTIQLPETAP
jgi:hypothetical protein